MLNNIAFGIVIGLLLISLVVLFCVLLVKLYIRKIKNYTKVIYQKDIDLQKAINTTILETQEQVLNNISLELHDDAGQQLTYINFQMEHLKLDSPEIHLMLEPISESLRHLSKSIRNISHSLNNQLLLQQDLVKAIESEIARLQKNSAINIRHSFAKTNKSFTSNEKIVIYRIFQEIMNNIFKHSGGKNVDIHMGLDPFFKLSVSDDGKGFDPDSKDCKPTLGLAGMKQRAMIINYKLDIVSLQRKGTTVVLTENN